MTRLNPESTRQLLALTWQFWSRLILCSPWILIWILSTRVDSTVLGVDSNLRARTPDPLSFGSSSLGVDSNFLGGDSALSFRKLVFCHLSVALPWSRLELSGSRLESQSRKTDPLYFGAALPWSRLDLSWSRLASQRRKYRLLSWGCAVFGVDSDFVGVDSNLSVQKLLLWVFPCVPLRVDSRFLWSRPDNHWSRLAFLRSRLESQGRKSLSDFSAFYTLESTRSTLELTRQALESTRIPQESTRRLFF